MYWAEKNYTNEVPFKNPTKNFAKFYLQLRFMHANLPFFHS